MKRKSRVDQLTVTYATFGHSTFAQQIIVLTHDALFRLIVKIRRHVELQIEPT